MPDSCLGYRSNDRSEYGSSPVSRHRPSIFQRRVPRTFWHDTSGETERLLRAATRSAELNDRILPKIGFSTAQKLVNELHNVGLIAAHTGTILGFVLPEPIDRDLQRY